LLFLQDFDNLVAMIKKLFKILLLFIIIFLPSGVFASVIINEIAWMGSPPEEGETGSQAANDEWIELYNSGETNVNITGWRLESADGAPVIQLEGQISAGGYFLLSRANNSVNGVSADLVYPYKGNALSNNGEDLRLVDTQGNIVDRVDASSGWPAGDNETKQTMERTNSGWQTSQNPGGTPKMQNSSGASLPTSNEQPRTENGELSANNSQQKTNNLQPVTDEQQPTTNNSKLATDNKTSVVYPKGIIINELLPSPEGQDEEEEWIEIFNQNETQVDISSWTLSDIVGTTHKYTLPEGSIIGPKEFLVIPRPKSGIILNNSGDGIKLRNPADGLEDEVSYEKAPTGMSFGRYGDKWQWGIPTPGAPNKLSNSFANLQKDTAEKNKQDNSGLFAAVAQQSAEKNKNEIRGSFFPFFSALFLAIFGGIFVLFLKTKQNKIFS